MRRPRPVIVLNWGYPIAAAVTAALAIAAWILTISDPGPLQREIVAALLALVIVFTVALPFSAIRRGRRLEQALRRSRARDVDLGIGALGQALEEHMRSLRRHSELQRERIAVQHVLLNALAHRAGSWLIVTGGDGRPIYRSGEAADVALGEEGRVNCEPPLAVIAQRVFDGFEPGRVTIGTKADLVCTAIIGRTNASVGDGGIPNVREVISYFLISDTEASEDAAVIAASRATGDRAERSNRNRFAGALRRMFTRRQD